MSRDDRPRLGVALAVLADRGRRILLGERGGGPNEGMLVLPGGGVELGESIAEAAVRELKEEAGVDVSVVDAVPIYVMEMLGRESHRVCLVYRARLCRGDTDAFSRVAQLRASRELPSLGWYVRGEVPRGKVSPPVLACLVETGLIDPPDKEEEAWF